jgi:hypothetical protein
MCLVKVESGVSLRAKRGNLYFPFRDCFGIVMPRNDNEKSASQ